MKNLLLFLFSHFILWPTMALAETVFEVEVGNYSSIQEKILTDRFEPEDLDYLESLAEDYKVTVIFTASYAEFSDGKTPGCEVKIERKSKGGGGLSVAGPVGSASGQGSGALSSIITIKGPCREVAKLLKMALDDGS